MFCYQCQEAAKGTGCTIKGVCGKTPETSGLLDMLIYTTKGISILANIARNNGIEKEEANKFTIDALFISITNANFDNERIISEIRKGIEIRENLKNTLKEKGIDLGSNLHDSVTWIPTDDNSIMTKAAFCGVLSTDNEDVRSLR
jgi:hydroxylamine reductase